MTSFRLNGVPLVADASGALWWPTERLLAVADLHLEKGSSFAARGQLLPPYDSRATLQRLAAVVERLQPRQLLCLGDSFHDAEGPLRLPADGRQLLAKLAEQTTLLWVLGNHDVHAPHLGLSRADFRQGALFFCHEAAPGAVSGEVSGHFHPKARLPLAGHSTTRRCFVTDGRRVILPAFGAFTGGLSVLDPAIARLFPEGFDVIALGEKSTARFPRSALLS